LRERERERENLFSVGRESEDSAAEENNEILEKGLVVEFIL
jgi:hypothetical protein